MIWGLYCHNMYRLYTYRKCKTGYSVMTSVSITTNRTKISSKRNTVNKYFQNKCKHNDIKPQWSYIEHLSINFKPMLTEVLFKSW